MSTVTLAQHHSAIGKLEAQIAKLQRELAAARPFVKFVVELAEREDMGVSADVMRAWLRRTALLLPVELR